MVKFRGLGGSGPAHSGQFLIHPKIVLKSNRSQGLVFPFNFYSLFGLDCLMQAVAPAPAGHQPSCKFIDDNHLPVFDYVIHILLKKTVGAQGLLGQMFQRHCLHRIEIIRAPHPGSFFLSLFSEVNQMLFFLDDEVKTACQVYFFIFGLEFFFIGNLFAF